MPILVSKEVAMTTNMGRIDRTTRLIAAAVLLYIAFGSGFAGSGVLHWLAIGVASIFALTAIAGNCPLYSVFGLKTCRSS
jgi:Inner membrane protein YgaP-like, transmembrane domain